MKLKLFLAFSALLVGFLYILPPLFVKAHLEKSGQVFALNFDVYRDELFYLSRAREIYDGHFPPSDLYYNGKKPTVQNPLPSLILAGLIYLWKGNIVIAYLTAQFIFTPIIFLLLYILGKQLFQSPLWAIAFAYITVLTPMALRVLNFHGA